MKLEIERDALLRGTGAAAAIADKRAPIPTLANALLEAEGDTLRIIASDLSLQTAISLPAAVETPGAITAPAHLLLNIAREAPPGPISLSLGQCLSVESGRSRWRLQTLPADDFPRFANDEPLTQFSLPAAELARLIARVEFAQHRGPTRPYLCGVRLECEDGELLAVATDAQRLAVARTAAPAGAEGMAPAIIPAKFVGELLKLLDGAQGDCALAFSSRLGRIEAGGATLIGKLVEGDFPDWRRIMPAPNGRRLLCHREAFAGALRRAAAVADGGGRAARLDLSRDKLCVTVASAQNDSGQEEAPAVYEAEDLTIGFNSAFLLETFNAMGGDELEAHFGEGPAALCLFQSPDDASAQWVVAPMRV